MTDHADRPTVLFVCVHNAGRSQMAAGFLSHLSDGRVTVLSAGSQPADQVNPVAVQAMAEVGIDIAHETPKLLSGSAVLESDVVDHHGLRGHLPDLPGQALRGLGPRRPGRPGPRRRPPDPRRDQDPRGGAARRPGSLSRMGSLLVAGTTSDAGKTVVTTGLCRALSRRGVRVAPFKAQNMSNNSMVTADGSEIGRAQWVQALAARAEPESAMNPVLLKPGSDLRSHVVVRGRPAGTLDASSFSGGRTALAEAAFAAYDELDLPLRRRRLRGGRQPRRDQPAGARLRQHGARPARRHPHRARRRHRPRRGVRRDARHARAARRRRPGAGGRLRGQQVPRRRRPAPAGPRHAGGAHRATRARRAAVAAGALARLGGLAGAARPRPRRPPPTTRRCGSRSSCCRGSATSPTSTRCASSRGCA